MKKGEEFERFVAAIHMVLDGSSWIVHHDKSIKDSSGASNQIDVYLESKSSFCGPILISAKDWSDPVGIDHIREWADIVRETGASAGVIVARTGFTRDAKKAAGSLTRRLSLWTTRKLKYSDFSTNEVAAIKINLAFYERRINEKTFNFEAHRADGPIEGRKVEYNFSAKARPNLFLRDDKGEIVGNLWDLFVERSHGVTESSTIVIETESPTYLVFQGIRMKFVKLSFEFY